MQITIKIILIFTLMMFLLTSCDDNKSNEPPGFDNPLENSMQKKRKSPKKRLTPPPLLPAIDPPEESLDDLMNKAGNSPKQEQIEAIEDRNILYQWTDNYGQVHMSDNINRVPEHFRKHAIRKKKSTPSKANTGKTINNLGPSEYTKQRKKDESRWQNWADKWKAAKDRAEKIKISLEDAKTNPPPCGVNMLAGMDNTFDPKCEERYKEKLKRLEQAYQNAQKRTNDIKENARRKGVPPGYFR